MAETPEVVYQCLLTTVKSLQLATVDQDGNPRASYAPFIRNQQGQIYIFISQLAGHTQDLVERSTVSVLLIEDEASTKQLFARTRASFDCHARLVDPSASEFSTALEIFTATFGDVVQLLRSLPDFILFCLQPVKGRFVMGFGQAYELSGEGLMTLQHSSG